MVCMALADFQKNGKRLEGKRLADGRSTALKWMIARN
jgi:hypothetical protein